MCPANARQLYHADYKLTGSVTGFIRRTVCSSHTKGKPDEECIKMNPVPEENVYEVCWECRK